MEFYFSIFIVLAIFSLLEIFNLKEEQRKKLLLICSLVFFCLSFLRWETGTDWKAYYAFFERSISYGQESDFEWGFSRLNEFAKITFDNYSVLLFLLGIVLFSFQTVGIYRLSLYPITALLFLWAISFGNVLFIRQSVATAILFCSTLFIIDRRFKPFLLCIALAMLFHRTSIIFLPARWIYQMRINPILLWIGVGVSVLMTAGVKTLFESIAGSLGPIVQMKLDVYLADSDTTMGSTSSLAMIIFRGVINKVAVFGAVMLFYKKIISSYPYVKGLINLYWFGILLYFATIGISVAMVRLSFAYDMLQIVLMPLVFAFIPNKGGVRLCAFVLFVTYLALRHYIALFGSYHDLLVPFKFV